jgi:hypothetical protein
MDTHSFGHSNRIKQSTNIALENQQTSLFKADKHRFNQIHQHEDQHSDGFATWIPNLFLCVRIHTHWYVLRRSCTHMNSHSHVCVCICTHLYTFIRIAASLYVFVRVRSYARVFVCICECWHVLHIFVHMFPRLYVWYLYVFLRIHTYLCVFIRTHSSCLFNIIVESNQHGPFFWQATCWQVLPVLTPSNIRAIQAILLVLYKYYTSNIVVIYK